MHTMSVARMIDKKLFTHTHQLACRFALLTNRKYWKNWAQYLGLPLRLTLLLLLPFLLFVLHGPTGNGRVIKIYRVVLRTFKLKTSNFSSIFNTIFANKIFLRKQTSTVSMLYSIYSSIFVATFILVWCQYA